MATRLDVKSPRLFVCILAAACCMPATESKPDDAQKAVPPVADPMRGKKLAEVRDDNGLKMELVWCPPGFVDDADEKPRLRQMEIIVEAKVLLTKGYWLGKYEVTQSEWKQVMKTEPWKGEDLTKEGEDYPATFVSWNDALDFCRKMTEQERQANRLSNDWEYTLPTEAQWERACRARTETRFSFGDDESKLGDYAWCGANARWAGEEYAHRVGKKKPNPWGLYDMHGNVWEWCRDVYTEKLPRGRDPVVKPDEKTEGSDRVLKGGSWRYIFADWGCGLRYGNKPVIRNALNGFRLALTAAEAIGGDSADAAAPADESALGAARLPTSDKAILTFFHKRTQPSPGRAVIEQLARALDSQDATEADDAQAELVSIGAPVVPVLREVANRVDDVRASRRAKEILRLIEGPGADRLPVEAARLLAARKAPGTAEALLDYLPFADNDAVFEDFISALTVVGFRDGKADPGLLAALNGSRGFSRAAAARALCKAGGNSSWKIVRPLLTDADPAIRFQAALALADARDSQAIPVLIECLSDAPAPLAAKVEEYLANLAGDWTVHGPRGSDLVSRELRRALWATWWQKTSGELLLREVQARTLTDEELTRAQALLRRLETEEPGPTATGDLVALGPRISPLLRRAVQENDPRLSPAAGRCLEVIERESPPIPLPEALFRMLALRRPPGTVAALLAFLPCAENEESIAQLNRVLLEVGVVDSEADPALVKALDDRVGIRRAVAAVTLRRGGIVDHFAAVQKLLLDEDIEVRRRVALELAEADDKEGAVTLCGLLENLPDARAWEIEEQLERLAGGKAPSEMTAEPIDWKNVAGAWRQWWQGERGKIVMTDSFVAASGGSLRGYTLLVQPQSNTITELDRDGKPRWTLTGLQGPVDAQVLANQHVLVAELGRVTERDLSGNILWKVEGIQPVSVQRLANGNTFIPCDGMLIEVDRTGKDVLRVSVAGRLISGIVAARKLRDGRIVAFERGSIIQLDQAGREVKRVPARTGGVIGGAGCNEVLDNGHVLVLSPGIGNISEFDMEGKVVGSFDGVPGASHGFRLPNGHTLVTARGMKYTELDKNWKPIKETALTTPAFRVKQR